MINFWIILVQRLINDTECTIGIYVCMDGLAYGWMGKLVGWWMDGLVDGRMDGYISGWMD